ncbi:hypothetical protein A3770_05p37260 [Chloropicon primus]|uniref:Uncharacterized protein n=1 Tax=Chloropicon primus TaxID=1764295 RepID=A0A5B8MKQ0_9CHLO|nr:hypothetical protein A3770_05p37260 [Chloropicon primus]|eukprot:QDZ21208.1 hypothetical protein A3770_05p37260 [Chloropicon primus]
MAHRGRLQSLVSGQVSLERMAEMMAPKLVDGRWRKPELSRRLAGDQDSNGSGSGGSCQCQGDTNLDTSQQECVCPEGQVLQSGSLENCIPDPNNVNEGGSNNESEGGAHGESNDENENEGGAENGDESNNENENEGEDESNNENENEGEDESNNENENEGEDEPNNENENEGGSNNEGDDESNNGGMPEEPSKPDITKPEFGANEAVVVGGTNVKANGLIQGIGGNAISTILDGRTASSSLSESASAVLGAFGPNAHAHIRSLSFGGSGLGFPGSTESNTEEEEMDTHGSNVHTESVTKQNREHWATTGNSHTLFGGRARGRKDNEEEGTEGAHGGDVSLVSPQFSGGFSSVGSGYGKQYHAYAGQLQNLRNNGYSLAASIPVNAITGSYYHG